MKRPRNELPKTIEQWRTLGGRLRHIPPGKFVEDAKQLAVPAVVAGSILTGTVPSAALARQDQPRMEQLQKRTVGEMALDALMTDLSRLPTGEEMRADVLNAADIACLARNAFNEARGEGFEGQLATILVALARTQDKRFPSSVCGVIYQPYQFS
jgi:hypothetical protein